MAKEQGLPPVVQQSFVTAAICINILGHGCVVGFPAVLLPQLEEPTAGVHLDKEAISWIASIMMITVLAGNFMMPSIMGRRGRRVASVCVMVSAIAGWLVTVVADGFLMLIIARGLLGLSFGLNLPLRSAVIGEYTSPKYRGAFLMIIALAQASGIFLVHLVGSIITWQRTALICISFHFVSLVMTLYTPESPSYLAMEGRFDECRNVFRQLRGDTEEEELEEMIAARSYVEEKGSALQEIQKIIKKKEFYKPVVIMIHAHAMMQFAGGTTFAAYSTKIITLILGPTANAYFWMIFLDGQRIISNCLAVYVINQYKRRTMMFLIGGICVASHIAIAAFVVAKNKGLISEETLWIPVILINIQFFSLATGMVPIPNVIAGEIFPFEYRGLAGSISVISVSLFSFLVLKTFPALSTSIGIEGIYASYAAAMAYFLIVIWLMLPETKGKTLQQIEDEFRGRRKTSEEELESLRARVDVKRKVSVISNMEF